MLMLLFQVSLPPVSSFVMLDNVLVISSLFSHLLDGNNLHQRGAMRINQARVYSTWHKVNMT